MENGNGVRFKREKEEAYRFASAGKCRKVAHMYHELRPMKQRGAFVTETTEKKREKKKKKKKLRALKRNSKLRGEGAGDSKKKKKRVGVSSPNSIVLPKTT